MEILWTAARELPQNARHIRDRNSPERAKFLKNPRE